GDPGAGVGASGERDRPDPVVGDDRLDRGARYEDGAKKALWESGVADDLFDRQRALWNVRRVLEETRVTRHECRRREPNDLPERKVPGHDRENDAQGLKGDETPSCIRADLLVGEIARRRVRKVLA